MKHIILYFIICFSCLGCVAQSITGNEIQSDSLKPYALIAGGSKGIGFGIAEALAKRGYNLILIARHMDTLLVAKKKIGNSPSHPGGNISDGPEL
ncbi:MAG TPA: SDR family NAD(P)-dependent oxidoreductase [Puia sp.]|nr:SDR family NAD(P)-dependent oxidoreductase [Puia sp.]